MKGIVHIEKLRLRAIIGTHDWERVNKQDIIVSLRISYDSNQACQSDRLSDALDYESLVKEITQIVNKSRCLLIEKLAASILKKALSHSRVQEATVRIDKPQAIPTALTVGFELSGHR